MRALKLAQTILVQSSLKPSQLIADPGHEQVCKKVGIYTHQNPDAQFEASLKHCGNLKIQNEAQRSATKFATPPTAVSMY